MPNETFPRDRFDDLPADSARVGAHRAENPRMRGWVVFLWAVVATVVIVVVGSFGTLIATGRVTLFPTPVPSAMPTAEVTPVIDTDYDVLVLNATPESGLASQMKETVIAAGWSPDAVVEGEAGSSDFETTTVFYAFPEDEAAAAGLAQAIGGAEIEQSEAYQPVDDPSTADVDESLSKQLVIVIGLDRTAAGASPEPTT